MPIGFALKLVVQSYILYPSARLARSPTVTFSGQLELELPHEHYQEQFGYSQHRCLHRRIPSSPRMPLRVKE